MLTQRRLPRSSLLGSMGGLLLAALASACGVDEPVAIEADAGLTPASLIAPTGVTITVRDADGPLAGALIVLRAPIVPGEHAPGVLWQALTDEAGALHALLPLRPDQAEIDVVVQRAGWDGPWSDETRRKEAGEFAPSSWQRLPVERLGALSISLTRRQP